MAELGPAQPQLVNLILFEQYVSVFNFYVLYKVSGFVLSSTGKCSEYQGDCLGIYDVLIDDEDPDKRVYNQRGGEYYLYKKNGDWYVNYKIGEVFGGIKTHDLKSIGTNWFYAVNANNEWVNDDNTIKFNPLFSDSCILSSRLHISSSGPAATAVPEYLGVFYRLPNKFSAGRPVWRNKHGKVLMIEPGYANFIVKDYLTSIYAVIRSGSGPKCPTDKKAGNSSITFNPESEA